jgi:cbb3-type cytochrome oxidase subunit 3
MDLNQIRIVVTLLSLACFGAIVWWTYQRTRNFDAAAALPFADEQPGSQGASNE